MSLAYPLQIKKTAKQVGLVVNNRVIVQHRLLQAAEADVGFWRPRQLLLYLQYSELYIVVLFNRRRYVSGNRAKVSCQR